MMEDAIHKAKMAQTFVSAFEMGEAIIHSDEKIETVTIGTIKMETEAGDEFEAQILITKKKAKMTGEETVMIQKEGEDPELIPVEEAIKDLVCTPECGCDKE